MNAWDDEVPGLHLRKFPTKSVFYLSYRANGVQRRPKLGDARSLTIKQAREIARGMLMQVAKGEDPSLQRQIQKREKTINDLFKECKNSVWNRETSWHKEVVRIYEREIKYRFGSRRVSAITIQELRGWHQGYRDRPIQGNRALAVFSRLFAFAEESGYRSPNSNPCLSIKNFSENKRDRFASHEELKKIAEILDREAVKNPKAVAFLYLLLFSGSRPSMIERATWNDLSVIDSEKGRFGILVIKKGKTGKDTVILPPQAMKYLDALEKEPGKTITGIKMPKTLWLKVKKEVGCTDLWARDFRRAFASIGLTAGHSIHQIGELLNHKSAQTTMIYAKLFGKTKLELAADIADKISEILKPDTSPIKA